jgi:hypothetical protein
MGEFTLASRKLPGEMWSVGEVGVQYSSIYCIGMFYLIG